MSKTENRKVTAPDTVTRNHLPIVVLGGSAGGLEAFQAFFRACRDDAGCAFIVLQHLPPEEKSELAGILRRETSLTVEDIADGTPIAPDHVYVLPPGQSLTLAGTEFRLEKREGKHSGLLVNDVMRSIADQAGAQAIGVVASGTGADGTDGIRAIREKGGMTLAQDPEEARFDGMPAAAIHSGLIDYIGPMEAMPEQIQTYLQNLIQDVETLKPDSSSPNQTLTDIIAVIARAHPNDFRRYKTKTLLRRIYRRMALEHTEHMKDYLALLKESPQEVKQLYRDLLISVTDFFRDPTAFKLLDEKVLTPLLEREDTDQPLRVWVPGCATGEEAYTIAILLHERMRILGKQREMQIFASDIDEPALGIAREGLYPESIKEHLSPELLNRYFTPEGNYYRIRESVREQIVFAVHNLITSAPFSRLDIISCRNLLIYLKLDVQSEIMNLFHFALNQGGYLFLGSSETIGRRDQLFSPVDRPHRIYKRENTHQMVSPKLPFTTGSATAHSIEQPTTLSRESPPRLGERVHYYLANHYSPPAVLASQEGNVLHFVGDTGVYLSHPSGQPNHQLFDIARRSIRSKLRSIFREAVDTGKVVHSTLIQPSRNGLDKAAFLVVTPLAFNQQTLYLITFEQPVMAESPKEEPNKAFREAHTEQDTDVIQQLEDELSSTRAELVSSVEDLETSNQDLKTAHEEAVSMNEELQSTNEELETSKEELQSLNEEMTTVNSELKSKVGQLNEAYSDLDNLLKSLSAATLFVDAEGVIRLFTPNCRDLLHVVQTDIGRPLEEIKFKVTDEQLLDDVRYTLDTLQTREEEVGDKDSRWFLRLTTPYRTTDNRVEGVVITYTDVTRLREAQEELREFSLTLEKRVDRAVQERETLLKAKEDTSRQRDAFMELSPMPLFVLRDNFTFVLVNAVWEHDFGWPVAHFYDKKLADYLHPKDWDRLRASVQKLKAGKTAESVKARVKAQDQTYYWLEWDIKRGQDGFYYGSGHNVTTQVHSAEALASAQESLKQQIKERSKADKASEDLTYVTLKCIGEAVLTTNTQGIVTTINPVAEQLLGYPVDDAIGKDIEEVLVLRDEVTGDKLSNPVKQVIRRKKNVAVKQEALLVRADGTDVQVEASISPVVDAKGKLLGTVGVLFDVSYSRKLNHDIHHRATHDDLTGLVNRGEFEKRLEAAVTGAQTGQKNHCLLYLDLDRFKIINDTCGHMAGDELLRQLSHGLQSHVRQRDTLARLGGDEFGLILENCQPKEAERIAEDFLTFIRNFRFVRENKSFQLGVSIGITNIDDYAQSPSKLLNQADNACYIAKATGRNRIHFFDPERPDEKTQKTAMFWANRVTQALEDDTLELVAQPIVCLNTNKAKGTHFELLARLNERDGEIIAPGYFLPAAERYNLMPSLDQHVVKKAFAWLAANPAMVKDLSICSINLSAASLEDDRFPKLLSQLQAEYDLPPEKICFEITETMAITNLAKTIALAEEFKRQGFMFALDDFGSGFASYHYLKRLPVDFLKIDGEFVRGIVNDPIDEAMVRSMNDIGHVMGKKTIAEHVESKEVMEKLQEMGVDYGQGYLTGGPDSLLNFDGEQPKGMLNSSPI